jgi:hypothetical protein
MYALTRSNSVIRLSDGVNFTTSDPDNADCAAYLAWLEDAVLAALAAIPGEAGEDAREDFAESTEFERDWPLVNLVAPVIGMTPADIDDLFLYADTL